VTIEAISDNYEDDSNGGLFKLTRLGDLSSALIVNVSRTGTATLTTDYSTGSTATFSANANTAYVSIASVDDDIYDPDETVVITITSGTGYTIGTADDATITIIDSTFAEFTLQSVDGGIRYDIEWDDLDSTDASQSVDVTNFAITVAGHTFTEANADFTTDPTAQFEYGVFVGLTFAIDTSSVGSYAYDEVSMSDMTVSAVLTGTSTIVTAGVAAVRPQALISFNQAANHTSTTQLTGVTQIRIRLVDENGYIYDYAPTIPEGYTVGDAVTAAVSNMVSDHWDATAVASGKGLVVNKRTSTAGVVTTVREVAKAGIFYAGQNISQPVAMGLNGVTKLVWQGTAWADA
jgi:hypothetical protein